MSLILDIRCTAVCVSAVLSRDDWTVWRVKLRTVVIGLAIINTNNTFCSIYYVSVSGQEKVLISQIWTQSEYRREIIRNESRINILRFFSFLFCYRCMEISTNKSINIFNNEGLRYRSCFSYFTDRGSFLAKKTTRCISLLLSHTFISISIWTLQTSVIVKFAKALHLMMLFTQKTTRLVEDLCYCVSEFSDKCWKKLHRLPGI